MTDNGTGESASGRLCAVSEFWELPGDPALCPGLRRRVRASLTGFPHTAADAELFANACRHSLSGDGGKVSVSLSGLRTGLVLVTVTDQGPKADPATGGPRVPQVRPPGDPLAPGGRGLRLVAELTTDWGHWATDEGGHTVWAVFEPPLPAYAYLPHEP